MWDYLDFLSETWYEILVFRISVLCFCYLLFGISNFWFQYLNTYVLVIDMDIQHPNFLLFNLILGAIRTVFTISSATVKDRTLLGMMVDACPVTHSGGSMKARLFWTNVGQLSQAILAPKCPLGFIWACYSGILHNWTFAFANSTSIPFLPRVLISRPLPNNHSTQ